MNHSRDTLGFMARSAADIALLDEICTGEAVGESPRLADLRIGVPTDYFFTDVDGRIAAVIDAELARLRDLGVELIEAQAPDFATARSQTTGPIMVSEFRDDLRNYLEEVGADLSVDALVTSIASPYVRRELEQIFSAASPEMAQRYERAIFEVMPRHRAEYLTYLRNNDLDAIALPTAPLLPGPVDENEKTTLNGQEVSIWQTLRNAVPASILGAPGLTLPVGMTRDGLPVGLELDGAPGGDKELLALGLAWERCSTPLSSP